MRPLAPPPVKLKKDPDNLMKNSFELVGFSAHQAIWTFGWIKNSAYHKITGIYLQKHHLLRATFDGRVMETCYLEPQTSYWDSLKAMPESFRQVLTAIPSDTEGAAREAIHAKAELFARFLFPILNTHIKALNLILAHAAERATPPPPIVRPPLSYMEMLTEGWQTGEFI